MFNINKLQKKPEIKKQQTQQDINLNEDIDIIEEEKTFRRGTASIKDLISPASIQVLPRYLKLGGSYVRTIFVINYPRYISVGWFVPILNLNSTFDVGMFFYPVRSSIILKQLKNKVGGIQAQIMSDAEKGAARDPLRETALHEIERASCRERV